MESTQPNGDVTAPVGAPADSNNEEIEIQLITYVEGLSRILYIDNQHSTIKLTVFLVSEVFFPTVLNNLLLRDLRDIYRSTL